MVQVKEDHSILAAIVCGSLSHGKIWDKSDVDLVLVMIDDKNVKGGVALCWFSVKWTEDALR